MRYFVRRGPKFEAQRICPGTALGGLGMIDERAPLIGAVSAANDARV